MNARRRVTGAHACKLCANPGREATARSLYATDAPPNADVQMDEGSDPPIERLNGK